MFKNYVNLNAWIRALENYLLTKEQYTKLIDSPLDYFFSSLKSSTYSKYLSSFKVEDIFDASLRDIVDLIINCVPESDRELFMVFKYNYDFYNFNCILSKNNNLISPLGSLREEELQQIVDGKVGSHSPLKEVLSELRGKDANFFEVRKYMFLFDIVRSYKLMFIEKLFKIKIDLLNICNYFRFHNLAFTIDETLFIPCGFLPPEFLAEKKIEDFMRKIMFTRYDKFVMQMKENAKNPDALHDDFILDFIDESKFFFFGPEVPFAYVLKKEIETKLLRKLYISKLANLDKEEIKFNFPKRYA